MIDTGARMSEGQFLELVHTDNWDTDKEEYMEIIISKTAQLTAACCECGAVIAGAGKEEAESLKEFGLNLGITFQLVDDLLDYTLSEEEFGKPVGKDLREGKVTLPLIYTLSGMEKGELKTLEKIFKDRQADDKDYEYIISLVRRSGNIEKVRAEAMGYMDKACSFLKRFPDSSYKEDLIDLNKYIAERNF